MALLPSYFYHIMAKTPDGNLRWFDNFAWDSQIVNPLLDNPKARKMRYDRNSAYRDWFYLFTQPGPNGERIPIIRPKNPLWQAIRVHNFKHSESTKKDWWENYQDAVFRVFVNPETIYDGKAHKQWYVLSPEDCFLVNRYELEKKGPSLPPRNFVTERFIPSDKRLRRMLLIPVECCKHMRHETTGGQLPEGL